MTWRDDNRSDTRLELLRRKLDAADAVGDVMQVLYEAIDRVNRV